jgi:hypothetical protein
MWPVYHYDPLKQRPVWVRHICQIPDGRCPMKGLEEIQGRTKVGITYLDDTLSDQD